MAKSFICINFAIEAECWLCKLRNIYDESKD